MSDTKATLGEDRIHDDRVPDDTTRNAALADAAVEEGPRDADGAGRETGSERKTASDGNLTPGSGETPPVLALVSPAEHERLQADWDRAQLGFIDDPRAATEGAAEIAAAAVKAVTRSLAARLGELDAWQNDASGADTELMRKAMRGYRDLIGSLTGR